MFTNDELSNRIKLLIEQELKVVENQSLLIQVRKDREKKYPYICSEIRKYIRKFFQVLKENSELSSEEQKNKFYSTYPWIKNIIKTNGLITEDKIRSFYPPEILDLSKRNLWMDCADATYEIWLENEELENLEETLEMIKKLLK